MKDLADTICALSTPPGRSGVAIVRVSGIQCFSILRRIFVANSFQGKMPPRHAMLGRIVDPRNGYEVDEAIATCFPSPNSFTREDVAEISIHGSPVLVAALLDCICGLGARLADPGEFTLRAFLNGRIDLTQAEAVQDLINATTLYQAQVAGRQRSGALAKQLKPVKELLIDIIVNLETAVEFVEEELPIASREQIIQRLEQARQCLQKWIDGFRRGRIIRDGLSMAIAGRPNVGKSSVFNALLAQSRSIVTDMPGTTRDLISEYMDIGGIPIRLQDTAGIHNSDDQIERFGMDRSYEAIADADVVLLVVNIGEPRCQQDLVLKRQLADLSCIAVMNKSDLPSCWSDQEKAELAGDWPCVEVSAKKGYGINELREIIISRIMGPAGTGRDGILVTNLRHCHSLEEAERNLASAKTALQGNISEEFVIVDLHRSLEQLDTITGETHAEDLLDKIFSRFCIGK
jgi:tRNA modification GTPase